MKYQKNKHILLNDLDFILPVRKDVIIIIIEKLNLNLLSTDKGQILSKDDYYKLLSSTEYINAKIDQFKVNIANYQSNLSPDKIILKKDEISKELSKIKYYLDKLSNIHFNYSNNFDYLNDKSPLFASYLSFTKVISLSYSIYKGLSNYDLNILLFYRPLSEALTLSEFFLINNDEKYLKEWFFEEIIPKESIMLESIKKYYNTFNNPLITDLIIFSKSNLNYNLSKPIHNSYKSIIYHINFEIVENKIKFSKINYSESDNYFEILNYIKFLFSVILNIYQTYKMCFEVINKFLDDKDIETINILLKELTDINNKK